MGLDDDMSLNLFHITADKMYWIKGEEDDPQDLCLHGDVTVVIGSETLKDSAAISATALYLLKSLTDNHSVGEELQLLPCCGFFLIADKELANVDISGCPNGTDWSVIHEGDDIRLITASGNEAVVPLTVYQAEVFRFADSVEAYYKKCTQKQMPTDEFDRNGYIAFWNEWNRRRYGAMI